MASDRNVTDMTSDWQDDEAVHFGPFLLVPRRRTLEHAGQAVRLSGRGLDILIALVERAGEVLTKKDLTRRVWCDEPVEDGTLRVHITTLRKVLRTYDPGADYVTNIAGRGYTFVAAVSRSASGSGSGAGSNNERIALPPLPVRLVRIIGRDGVIAEISNALAQYRCVTIVGAGGVGKTTVAMAIARDWWRQLEGDVAFADLASTSDPAFVPGALAAVLGVPIRAADPLPQLLSLIKSRRLLVVLDSCEHVIDATAALVAAILSNTTDVRLLVTSREALRIDGECVYRLGPLKSPPTGRGITAREALTYSAVELFVERAKARFSGFEIDDAAAPGIARLCRDLDGIALAIEFAAGQVDTLGITGTVTLLADRFRLLSLGWRTSVPRQQSLMATLDWSHELLSDVERTVFRRLGVFVGPFSMSAVRAIATGDAISAPVAIDALIDLVAKSLIVANFDGDRGTYRLLQTTRAYAIEKLSQSGEQALLDRRHAHHFFEVLSGTANDCEPDREQLGNARAALAWAFSAEGDRALGVRLASAASRLFLDLSLFIECHDWTEKALESLDTVDRGTRCEMELLATRAVALPYIKGNCTEVEEAWHKALHAAETLDDVAFELRILDGLFIYYLRVAQFRDALMLAERAKTLAERLPPSTRPQMEWMPGIPSHFMGELAATRVACSAALNHARLSRRANMVRFGIDPRIQSYVVLARTHWLEGRPDLAASVAHACLLEAQSVEHPTSICVALTWLTSIPLWNGDLSSAKANIDRLQTLADEHSLSAYQAIGQGLSGELALCRGDPERAIGLLRGSLDALHRVRHEMLIGAFLGSLGQAWAAVSQRTRGLAAVDSAIAFVEQRSELLYLPDLLRVKGEILATTMEPDVFAIEQLFEQSLATARKQGALAWQLRTAMSIVRFRRSFARLDHGADLLESIYRLFPADIDTADLCAARRMLSVGHS